MHGSERHFPTTKAPTLVVACLNLSCLPRPKLRGVREPFKSCPETEQMPRYEKKAEPSATP